MSRRQIVLISAAAVILIGAAAALFFTNRAAKEPAPPPDLTGDWTQHSDGDWYHIATIEGDTIEVWWYLPAEDLRELYWSGTFVPPADGKEPYSWESANHYTAEDLSEYKYRRTSREEVKTFTYKNGQLSYIVTAGHLRMTFALWKAEE